MLRRAIAPAPLRIGGVEHHQIGAAPERRSRRSKTADEGRILGAVQQIVRRIVAGVDQEIGGGDTFSKRAGLGSASPFAPT